VIEHHNMPCIKWWGRKKNSNLASQMERRLVEKDAEANLMCGTGWWFRHIMSLELPWDVSDFSACGTKWLNTTTFTATFGCWSHFFLTGIFPTPPFGGGLRVPGFEPWPASSHPGASTNWPMVVSSRCWSHLMRNLLRTGHLHGI
jgi:hypothetical protein